MKIIALEASNVKHLHVVNIKPDGSIVVIGGDNSHGKSCVLDSIQYALNGAGSIPSKPIRKGQKKARIVLDLGDIVVTRVFTDSGTNLTVKNKDGATFASPQAMLDRLVGELTFDPLEFSKMDTRKQAEVLKQLVGLDFKKINMQRQTLFDQRTIVNRDGKATKTKLAEMTEHDDVPEEEVSVSQLGQKYAEAIEQNKCVEQSQHDLVSQKKRLAVLRKQVAELMKSIKADEHTLATKTVIDTHALSVELANSEETNRKVRENAEYIIAKVGLEALREKSASLGAKLTKIDRDKAKVLAKTKFPIEGLAIEEDGVTFEDIPFVQCSSAQRIRISVAIGLAMNPKLKVLLIREGSLLDEKNLAMIAEMAEKADAQIWVERVSQGDECQIIIQDGEVKNAK